MMPLIGNNNYQLSEWTTVLTENLDSTWKESIESAMMISFTSSWLG